jgi:hypothetical protein
MFDIIGLFILLFAVIGITIYMAWRNRTPLDAREEDPPGVRSIVTFHGDDPSLTADDDPEDLLVGICLFDSIRDALNEFGVTFERRDRLQCAERLTAVVDDERFALVLEHVDPEWALSVEWAPSDDRERRYQEREYAVFAPNDGPALRSLLSDLDQAVQAHPLLSEVVWHRRQDWADGEWENGDDVPYDEDEATATGE